MNFYRIQKLFLHVFTLTRLLYILNALFTLTLISHFMEQNRSKSSSHNELSWTEKYSKDISNAMEAFDFMHHQKLAAKPIPPPEDAENLPITSRKCRPWFWTNPQHYSYETLNSSIRWNNRLWQSVESAKREIYLYSAFYDDRSNAIFPDSSGSVQIIGVVWRFMVENVHCQLWMDDNKEPFVVKALWREIWQRAWDPRDRFYLPILFTCPLPSRKFSEGNPLPKFVSLVTTDLCAQKRAPSNFLSIHSHKTIVATEDGEFEKKQHTVICVKGMDFLQDLSVRFVEWLELNYHVGADKVVIYTYTVHPRMRKVIDYYQRHYWWKFQHLPLTLAGHQPNSPLHRSKFIKRNRQQKRRQEIVPYNDCLYRHLGTHQYVLIVDVDELVVPLKHENWKEMLNEVKMWKGHMEDDAWTAFSIANAFFFDNLTSPENKDIQEERTVPNYMHILKHHRRSTKISPPGIYGKSFMDTRNVATVFNHFPLHKQRRRPDLALKSTFYVDPNLARKNHYKGTCPIESRDECPDLYGRTMKDDSATRYANRVMPKIRKALKEIGIQPEIHQMTTTQRKLHSEVSNYAN